MQTAEPETRPDLPNKPGTVAVVENGGGWLGVINKLIDRGTPVADLKILFDMQQASLKEMARLAFKRDYAAFRAECPRLEKDKLVSFTSAKGTTSYRHILIATAVDTLTPILSAHGLSHRWETRQKEGGIIEVTCYLEHEAGHMESATLWGAADMTGNKNSIQAVASTVTYLQRYTFLTVTGSAAKDADTDGMTPEGDAINLLGTPELDWIQASFGAYDTLVGKAKAAGKPIKGPLIWNRFLEWLKVEKIDDATQASFGAIRELIERKTKEAGGVPVPFEGGRP
jgi:hypothetical protein